MAKAARAFDEQRGGSLFRGLPHTRVASNESRPPWSQIHKGEFPPMMFQLRLRDGSMTSFPYGSLLEIACRDAGQIRLYAIGRQKHVITLEGRHLRELANLLGRAAIVWLEESDPRDISKPESAPEIVRISIETFED